MPLNLGPRICLKTTWFLLGAGTARDHITLGSNGSHWAGVSSKHYAAGGPLSIALGERVGQWTLVPGLYWNHILVPMIFFFP